MLLRLSWLSWLSSLLSLSSLLRDVEDVEEGSLRGYLGGGAGRNTGESKRDHDREGPQSCAASPRRVGRTNRAYRPDMHRVDGMENKQSSREL